MNDASTRMKIFRTMNEHSGELTDLAQWVLDERVHMVDAAPDLSVDVGSVVLQHTVWYKHRRMFEVAVWSTHKLDDNYALQLEGWHWAVGEVNEDGGDGQYLQGESPYSTPTPTAAVALSTALASLLEAITTPALPSGWRFLQGARACAPLLSRVVT
jgi:hypothetical protein